MEIPACSFRPMLHLPSLLHAVGANKGFVISQFLALFASHLGHNPQSLYNFLVSNPTLLQTMPRERAAIWACGSCGDCHEVVPARPATAAKQSVLAHAMEPIGMNVQLIRDWQTNRSIGTDILGVHQLACTIDDGPVTMEIPVANSQLPGEEVGEMRACMRQCAHIAPGLSSHLSFCLSNSRFRATHSS